MWNRFNSTNYKKEENIKKEKKKLTKDNLNKIFNIISLSSCFLVIFFSTLFTFLVGVSSKLTTSGVSIPQGENYSIYFFFGEVFNNIQDVPGKEYSLFFPIFGLIVICLILIAVIVNMIFLAKEIIHLINTKKVNIIKHSVISYILFLTLSLIFNLFMNNSMTTGEVVLTFGLNGATIAGIVLGAIFLIVSIVMNELIKGINTNLKNYLFSTISSSLLIILSIIGFSLLGANLIKVDVDGQVKNSLSNGIYTYGETMSNRAILIYSAADDNTWNKFVSNYIFSVLLMTILVVLIFVVIINIIRLINKSVDSFGGKPSLFTKSNSIII